ncbi:uncharacterized protein TM35_000201420 [Trypanosoma theileri]|uniref:Uncharacterized protein n=1 Tax=Trypanosoma theileri TaxID=67003 RepID=A0A1X0NTD9_9TRYP|nr:uncharacterized protein TM35_000201420 [Trypanosoma theileri]ORC87733.1 hypothetical protein TM35_000201420 [Trypanosoma theileri]
MSRWVECPELQLAALSSPVPSTTMSTCSSWAVLDSVCSSQPPPDPCSLSTPSANRESARTPAVCALRFTAATSSSPCASSRDVWTGRSPSEWSMLFVEHSPTWSECGTRELPAAEVDPAGKSTNTTITTTTAAAAGTSAATDVKENDEREEASVNERRQYFSFRPSSYSCGLFRCGGLPFISHCGLHNTAALRCSQVLFAGKNELCAVVQDFFLSPLRRFDFKETSSSESDMDSFVQSLRGTPSIAPSTIEDETVVKSGEYSSEEMCSQESDAVHSPLFNLVAFRAFLGLAALMFIGQIPQREGSPRYRRRSSMNRGEDGRSSIGQWFANNLESLALSALHGIIVFVL